MPLKSLHGNRNLREDVDTYRLYPNVGIAKRPEDFVMRVNEFMKRSLSYESDILNAISGVFKVFEKASSPVRQICGVPIFPIKCIQFMPGFPPSQRPRISIPSSRSFLIGLSWAFKETGSSITRRTGFPSWSWAGWSGWETLTFPSLSFAAEYPSFGLSGKLNEEYFKDRREVKIYDINDETTHLDLDIDQIPLIVKGSPKLSLTSFFVLLSIRQADSGYSFTLQPSSAKAYHSDDSSIFRKTAILPLNDFIGTGERRVHALLLDYEEADNFDRADGSSATTFATFLLLDTSDLHCYHRVGIANVVFRGWIRQRSSSDFWIMCSGEDMVLSNMTFNVS
jgi:hypothetical protein